MQSPDDTSKLLALLHARLVRARVSGDTEERTYRSLGLTMRVRRPAVPAAVALQEPEPVAQERAQAPAAPPPMPADAQLTRPLMLEADAALPLLSARMQQAAVTAAPENPDPLAPENHPLLNNPPESAPQPTFAQYDILCGKTAAVIGFSKEDSGSLGQMLAAQQCSFLLLSRNDAEYRRGSTNGCDLLLLSVPAEWAAPGSLHVGSLLNIKKPVVMFGEREVLTKLVNQRQVGLRELIPTPWTMEDAIWRAATLLSRADLVQAKNGRKNQRKKVIIGDESAARSLVHAVLAQEGMECHVAGNGVDALALARSKQADAVIVDVSLPGLDGFQVLAEIRRDPLLKDIVVILLTGRQAEADVLRGFGLGAHDYVTKPFSPMELAARLKRFLVKK